MDKQRIGEVLGQMGTLSGHDIDEILSEQRATRARFGTIAVSMGFCQPEHIWAAWCSQLDTTATAVDLDEIGVDTQAVDCLPRELAFGLRAMPVRLWEGQLIVAVSDPSRAGMIAEMARRTGMRVKCVLASEAQISEALESYYCRSVPA